MVRGYLLDTNILSYWFNCKYNEHAAVLRKVNLLAAADQIHISVISLGEIEFGHKVISHDPTPIQERFASFVNEQFPYCVGISRATTVEYGRIRAELFRKYSPRDRRRMVRWPEQLVDPVSARELGIQENDIWMAANAIEYNLILATNDGFNSIRAVEPRLRIEDWVTGADKPSGSD